MLQLHNHTPHQAGFAVLPDRDGADTAVAMLKATFPLRRGRTVAPQPIRYADEFVGEPGRSHLRAHADLSLEKPGTDVVINGIARSRDAHEVTELLVSLRVAQVDKLIRVVGERVWEAGVFGPRLSAPQPFTTMPLTWDRAFGGVDQNDDDQPQELFHPQNPAGRGFRRKRSQLPLIGSAAPNLEPFDHPLRSAKSPIPAVNVAALAPSWEPRARWAGTYDEKWQRTRAPFLPQDFDPRFLHVAPEDQIVPGGLSGGETIDLDGVHPHGPLQLMVPQQFPEIVIDLAGAQLKPQVRLDTVEINTEHGWFTVLWRACQRCDKQALRLRSLTIHGAECAHG